ncbi:hypothetical protein [Dactylosporangium sp. CA-092794]|uniref:hypothetical protein n=1 Tax=Dactylosporangium sp. CA-092794 TaxID=3239929 RepID=UPI003D8B8AC8
MRAGAAGADDRDAQHGDGGLDVRAEQGQLPGEPLVGDPAGVEYRQVVSADRHGAEGVSLETVVGKDDDQGDGVDGGVGARKVAAPLRRSIGPTRHLDAAAQVRAASAASAADLLASATDHRPACPRPSSDG